MRSEVLKPLIEVELAVVRAVLLDVEVRGADELQPSEEGVTGSQHRKFF